MLNKFMVTKEVKEVQAIEERVMELNSCGFKTVLTDYGKVYAHNGQVVVGVMNTDEYVADKALEAGFDNAKEFTKAIKAHVKSYISSDDCFYLANFNPKAVTVNDLVPQTLIDDLLDMKEAGFTGAFNLHYKVMDNVVEVKLSPWKYNGYFHRNK